MGKCLRRSCRQRLSPAVEAAAYLTLRSGRRVPAAAGSGSPRWRHRRGERCCGKAGADSAARQRRGRRVILSRRPARRRQTCRRRMRVQSSPATRASVVTGSIYCILHFFSKSKLFTFCSIRRVAPHSGEPKHDHHESDAAAVEPRWVSSPPEAEIEAFLAAAEFAERRRFIETYNYDIALDRPLEGRFDWSPVVST
ncbi:hypothetical protein ACQ4PT_051162 [Festuca glaucescens]